MSSSDLPRPQASSTSTTQRRALILGASGYIGRQLAPRLLDAGWSVRVLARTPGKLPREWQDRVEIQQGDAGSARDLATALGGIDVAYYLVHSMGGDGDFVARDRQLAETFAAAAERAALGRMVYLSGLHPDGELSPHLASRIEVGRVFLDCDVPAVVLQAGVVLGAGSASFDMLRHLTERLPAMVTPRWAFNRIQPIGVDDAIHYLVAAAEVSGNEDHTVDIGGPDVLTYAAMMVRYAKVTRLGRRLIVPVPVLTPDLASRWVGTITPVSARIARPLIGSLIHEAVCREPQTLLPEPPGGAMSYDEAIVAATAGVDPQRWRRTLRRTMAATLATAALRSAFAQPSSPWWQLLRARSWSPPPEVFPVVWTGLYAAMAVAGSSAIADAAEAGEGTRSRGLAKAYGANLVLNAGWSWLFWRARELPLAAVEAGVLTLSSADLARRSAPTGRGKAVAFGAYTAWCGVASGLTAAFAIAAAQSTAGAGRMESGRRHGRIGVGARVTRQTAGPRCPCPSARKAR